MPGRSRLRDAPRDANAAEAHGPLTAAVMQQPDPSHHDACDPAPRPDAAQQRLLGTSKSK